MNLWLDLKKHTQARIGLNRSGHSVSTDELLDFQLAHALARDAVHEMWNLDHIEKKLKAIGEKPLTALSGVTAREPYLKFPNLGRILNKESEGLLKKYGQKNETDAVFIVTDGLSPRAINSHLLPFWKTFKPHLKERLPKLKMTIVLVPFGRVALSDAIGKALKAKMSVMLVGERPGLSSSDSLAIYLTYAPKLGNSDANRNCISNVHPPEGLDYLPAAEKLLFLMNESLRLKLSGVCLKEELLIEY